MPISQIEREHPFSLVEVVIALYFGAVILVFFVAPLCIWALGDFCVQCVRECIDDVRDELR